MATARSRITKGRDFQRRLLEIFKEVFNLSSDDARTPVGSEAGPDLIFCNEATREKVGRLNVEAKNVKSLNLWSALDQCKKRLKKDEVPLLLVHRSISGNKDVWAVCPIEHYMDLQKRRLVLEEQKENESS